MATLYFKAAGGNFNGANWSTTGSGGGDSNTPTSADDCIVESGSGNMTINSGSACRSLDFTSGTGDYAGTITHSAGVTITIGDGTAGAGNVALKFSAGLTYTLGNASSSGITFASSSGTQQTITTAGKTLGGWTVNANGGSYILGGDITWSTVATFTLTNGTFNSGNYNMTGAALASSNSNTRTLTLGSSTVTLTVSGTPLSMTNSTNLTMTANTASFVFPTLNAVVAVGTLDMNGASATWSGGGVSNQIAGGTWANLTFTGTAAKTDVLSVSANNVTVTGTFTVTSDSDVNRVLIASATRGTSRTITAATVVCTNTVDFMDITGAGAATWTVAGTGATYLGDCGGNSGITFTTPAAQTASITTNTNWNAASWTSRVPLPQDDVTITGSGTRQLTTNMPRAGKNIDFSGAGGTLTINTSSAIEIYGSLTLASSNVLSGTPGYTFAGRGSHTITSAGVSFTGNFTLNCASGTYTLADAFTSTRASTAAFTITSGNFVSNGYSISVYNFASSNSNTRSITLGSSTVTITTAANDNAIDFFTSTGLTLSASSATFTFSNTSTSVRNIRLGGMTLGTVTYTLAGSTGGLTLPQAGTIKTLNFSDSSNARTLLITASDTRFETFNVNGTSGKNMIVNSSSAGTARYISIGQGQAQQTVNYVTFQDMYVIEPYKLFATNSTDTSNNRNITFSTAPTAPYIRQAKGVSSSATSHSLTFDYATTSGNLLIIALGARSAPGTLTPPTGFSVAKDNANTANSTIWYKVADGTETTLTTTSANSLTNPDYYIYEVAGFTGTPTLDVTAESDNASSTSQPIGTVSNTQSPAFAIGLASGNGTIGAYTTVPTNSWQQHYYATNGTPSSSGVAAIPLTATASQSSTITFTSARTGAGAMAIFYGLVSATGSKNLLLLGVG